MGGHPAPYDFTPLLAARQTEDDPILDAWTTGLSKDDRAWLERFTAWVDGQSDTADFVERPENRPRMAGKGPYDNDPQQVVLPAETWEALAAVHGSGLWREGLDPRARYAAVYRLNQHGEWGVTCSVACTDGLQRALRRHAGDDERARTILQVLDGATRDDWIHGAQFVTEIQGGSDAGTNAVEARPEKDNMWSLWGQKWFCSNLTADHWLVTARPQGAAEGTSGVALFCVPRDQDGYTVERLKDKLGTRALPTAEITFRGAKGWPVGALDRGIANMVGDVLVTSRIHNVLAGAAFQRRAVREARAYAGFRQAFGTPLASMPLVAASLESIEAAADRTEAGAFATVDAWLAAQAEDAGDDDRAWARVLVSIAKAAVTRETPGRVYEAMMVLGGNGIEERFTVLPRLWRDSAILETWEGPYTLLMMQALGDLVRFGVAGEESVFLHHALGDAGGEFVPDLAAILSDPDDPEAIREWPRLAHRIHRAWEEQALRHLRGHNS